jgi:hypothetical protein
MNNDYDISTELYTIPYSAEDFRRARYRTGYSASE